MQRSAGILLFRNSPTLQVLLAHPGGPFWRNRDQWTIPKGVIEEGEDPLAAAIREFREETGHSVEGSLIPLGEIRQLSGKFVAAWACQGELDATNMRSVEVELEWPRGSGKKMKFPEIDRCEWFDSATAERKLIAAQAPFLHRLNAFVERSIVEE